VAARFAEMLQAGDFGHWDDLTMPAMSADDPWVALFADELRARGMKTDLVPDLECRYIVLPATWDEYVAGLDGDSRYFVRRTLRDFEAWAKAEGGATLKRVNNEAEMAQGWDILLSGHAERWEGGGAFRSEKFKRFHQTVTRGLLAGTGGILDLLWLEVGRQVACVGLQHRLRRSRALLSERAHARRAQEGPPRYRRAPVRDQAGDRARLQEL
jgi:hypothetical protein